MPMELTDPVPFVEALERESTRTVLPTSLRTRMLQRIPAQIRARARFSAGMVHAEYLQVVDDVVQQVVSGELDSATALRQMDDELGRLGFRAPQEAGKEAGAITDHRSYKRQKLVLETNVAQAGGYGQWVQSQDPMSLELYPCQELYRAIWPKGEMRAWHARWANAGGQTYGERMIARKDDPIWVHPALNRFGTPYTPFDFNSGMRLRPIDRIEAEELGILAADDEVLPTHTDFRADVASSPAIRSRGLWQALERAIGDIAEVRPDGTLTMRGGLPSWSTIGLPSARDWTVTRPAPTHRDPREARQALEQGFDVVDWEGQPVHMGQSILDHWLLLKDDAQVNSRLVRLNYAIDAVRSPDEVWKRGGDEVFLAAFKSARQVISVVVFVEDGGRVITYFPSRLNQLDKMRQGRLIRERGTGSSEG